MNKALFFPLQVSLCTVSYLCAATNITQAQVTSDGTVNTQVNQNGNIAEITGGETRSDNLFHSFQDFSVPTGNEAFFNNASDIANIFSRVTGGNISNIDGLIRANDSASLFLINPAGIVFGSNARLDLGGSFYGSTADSILFEGGEFSATDLDNPPLLTVNAPIGLNFRDEPGDIVNQSVANGNGLQVGVGQSITLVGGDIRFDGGRITAPEGTVQIGSLTDAGIVNFQELSTGLSTIYESIEGFGSIQFLDSASISVDGKQGGIVNLQGDQISLSDSSQISSSTFDSGAGNDISLKTQKLFMQNNARIITTTSGQGEGGSINIDASDSVELIGTGVEEFQKNVIIGALNGTLNLATPLTGLVTGTSGSGQSGEINLDTSSLKLQNGALIFSPTFNSGSSGNINIESERVEISGSSIASVALIGSSGDAGDIRISSDNFLLSDASYMLSNTLSSGDAGNIFIDASDSVELLRTPEGAVVQTGIFPNSVGGTGKSGNVAINTSRLSIQDGAGIASVSGAIFGGTVASRTGGNAGNVNINASERIEISGISEPLADGTRIGSFISGQTTSSNSAGQLRIDTAQLNITDGGLISTATLDAGSAGELTINASDSIDIYGTAFDGQFASKIETSSGRAFSIEDVSASGNAGNLNIFTEKLTVRDGGLITATALGQGEGGSINIDASDSVELIGTGSEEFQQNFILGGLNGSLNLATPLTGLVTGTSGSGQSGEINLNTSSLNLQNGAFVFSPTLNSGNAGNINIESERVEIVGSSIASVALIGSSGDAGDIRISSDNLLLSDASYILGNTFGEGNAGNIFIDVSNSVELLRTPEGAVLQTGIFPNSFGGAGNSGNITINTSRLSIQDGAGIASASGGIIGGTVASRTGGEAGNIDISASELIEISGVSEPLADGTRIGSFISGQTTSNNSAGQLRIDTAQLNIADGGLISSATLDAGSAGELTINASDSIDISGTAFDGQFASKIETSSGRAFSIEDVSASGNAGNLNIFTEKLTVRDGGLITATALGQGEGGSININASDSVVLEQDGSIVAETAFTKGGILNLKIGKLLTLSKNSLLSAQAFNNASGGNLSIDSQFIIAFPEGNNDILASAEQGQGGNINIDVESLFGIQERNPSNLTNDINASSQVSGLDGKISITSPKVDPVRGATELPTNIVVPEETTQQACKANRQVSAKNGLNITGKGGLVPDPKYPLNSLNIITSDDANSISTVPAPIETSQGKIQPARGIEVTESGDIRLVAYRTNGAGERISDRSMNCGKV